MARRTAHATGEHARMGEQEHNKGRATMRLNALRNCENRCSAHGKDATPKRAAAVPGTYEVGMANAPLGSAGLAVLSAAASSQELGESCGPAARKLGQSCLEARFRRVISLCYSFTPCQTREENSPPTGRT